MAPPPLAPFPHGTFPHAMPTSEPTDKATGLLLYIPAIMICSLDAVLILALVVFIIKHEKAVRTAARIRRRIEKRYEEKRASTVGYGTLPSMIPDPAKTLALAPESSYDGVTLCEWDVDGVVVDDGYDYDDCDDCDDYGGGYGDEDEEMWRQNAIQTPREFV